MATGCSGDFQENFFHCPICTERYKEPKILHCLHSFCKICLKTYIVSHVTRQGKKTGFLCPVCRTFQESYDPRKTYEFWVDDFPTNFNIVSMMESYPSNVERCLEHGKPIEFSCSNHNEEICSHCAVFDHRQCEVTTIGIKEDSIEQEINRFYQKVSRASEVKKKLENAAERLKTDKTSIRTQILDESQAIRRKLAHLERKLLDELEYVYKKQSVESRDRLEKLDDIISYGHKIIDAVLSSSSRSIDEVSQAGKYLDTELGKLSREIECESVMSLTMNADFKRYIEQTREFGYITVDGSRLNPDNRTYQVLPPNGLKSTPLGDARLQKRQSFPQVSDGKRRNHSEEGVSNAEIKQGDKTPFSSENMSKRKSLPNFQQSQRSHSVSTSDSSRVSQYQRSHSVSPSDSSRGSQSQRPHSVSPSDSSRDSRPKRPNPLSPSNSTRGPSPNSSVISSPNSPFCLGTYEESTLSKGSATFQNDELLGLFDPIRVSENSTRLANSTLSTFENKDEKKQTTANSSVSFDEHVMLSVGLPKTQNECLKMPSHSHSVFATGQNEHKNISDSTSSSTCQSDNVMGALETGALETSLASRWGEDLTVLANVFETCQNENANKTWTSSSPSSSTEDQKTAASDRFGTDEIPPPPYSSIYQDKKLQLPEITNSAANQSDDMMPSDPDTPTYQSESNAVLSLNGFDTFEGDLSVMQPENQFTYTRSTLPYSTTYLGSLPIKTNTDKYHCYVDGACFLDSGDIIIADRKNKKLKIFSASFDLLCERMLEEKPFDVVQMSDGNIATTIPKKCEVQIFNVSLLLVNRIDTQTQCRGISQADNKLYVFCADPVGSEGCIKVYDERRHVISVISRDENGRLLFWNTNYISVCHNSYNIYFNRGYLGKSAIYCVDLKGKVKWKSKTSSFGESINGMAAVENGVIVAAGSVKCISKYGNKWKKLIEIPESVSPHKVAINNEKTMLLVTYADSISSGSENNFARIFRLKY